VRRFDADRLAARLVGRKFCSIDFGGDSGGAPDSDPNVGLAAKKNSETAAEMAGVAREQLAFSKQQYSDLKPTFDKISQQQLAVGDKNIARSDDQWQQYKSIFQPAEQQYAKEAMGYGTAQDQEQQAEMARSDVARSQEAQGAALDRDMARSGINPNSGAYMAAKAGLAGQNAADQAGAANMARRSTRLQGMAMRQGLAQFGRNMPATGMAADSMALNAGNSAGAAAAQPYAMRNAATQGAMPFYSGSVNAMGTSGNLLLGQQQAQYGAYSAGQNREAQESAGTGQLVGMLGAAAIMASSKEWKEDKRPVAARGVLARIKRIPVEEWRYKKGVADEGRHLGPYAEDVHREFGDIAAPGGRVIDIISMHGISLAGIKALAERVEKLEEKEEA
jgi:hypothetical protein